MPVKHYHSSLKIGFTKPSNQGRDMPYIFQVQTRIIPGNDTGNKLVALVVDCRYSELNLVERLLKKNPFVHAVKLVGSLQECKGLAIEELAGMKF